MIFSKRFFVNHSFFVRERAIHSEKTNDSLRLLFCPERPFTHGRSEQIAHSCSFLVSNLSDSLTVALFSWAIWANCSQSLFKMSNFEQKSDEQMREFPTLVVSLGAKWRNKINLIQNPMRATHLKVLFSKKNPGGKILKIKNKFLQHSSSINLLHFKIIFTY